jgi:hypothetical protein
MIKTKLYFVEKKHNFIKINYYVKLWFGNYHRTSNIPHTL